MTSLDEALASPGAGAERAFHCPVHGDTRPSASVNVLTGLWVCYTCGAKGKAGEAYTIAPDALVRLLKQQAHQREAKTYPEAWLNLFDAGPPHPYWVDRFSAQVARHFRLGYDPDWDAVTYPMRDAAGRVLGVVRRPLAGDSGAKYRYPYGVDVGQYLFNYSTDVRKVVVLVEGAADAIACFEVGFVAFAIYGTRFSAAQRLLLDRCGAQEIWTAFDLDEAGQQAHERLQAEIRDRPVHQLVWDRSLGKDIAEVPRAERAKLLTSTVGRNGYERVVSTTCESRPTQPPPGVGNSPSGTSTPGRLRISTRSR